jgi:branched-chain amino acid transport system ATP-binding protein
LTALLEASGVCKSFGAVTAASDINIEVPEQAVYSLIGTNGAGKTTFVNMVTGYITPDDGRITFAGRDITRLDPRAITRLGIRRSFQIPQLYNGLTVLENMMVALTINADRQPSFWKPARDPAGVEQAIDLLGRFRLQEQKDQLVPELSSGMRKLLDIAMAMAGHPKVMLLDEPTSGVAADEKFPIMDLVMQALKDRNVTILFVEHDMDIVTRYSERVLAFYDGRIIANDAPDEVLADPQVQRYVTGLVK